MTASLSTSGSSSPVKVTWDNLEEEIYEDDIDLRLSKMSKEVIEGIFPWDYDNTIDKRRFSYFDPAEVQDALISEKITKRYLLGLLSKAQLENLQLSKLSEKTIKHMFSWSHDKENDRIRFSYFQPSEVQEALYAGLITTKYQIDLISDEQMKGLDFSHLRPGIIKLFFPDDSIESLRKVLPPIPGRQKVPYETLDGIRGNKDIETIESMNLYTDEELEEMSSTQKMKNETLFSKLSEKQKEDLAPYLEEYVDFETEEVDENDDYAVYENESLSNIFEIIDNAKSIDNSVTQSKSLANIAEDLIDKGNTSLATEVIHSIPIECHKTRPISKLLQSLEQLGQSNELFELALQFENPRHTNAMIPIIEKAIRTLKNTEELSEKIRATLEKHKENPNFILIQIYQDLFFYEKILTKETLYTLIVSSSKELMDELVSTNRKEMALQLAMGLVTNDYLLTNDYLQQELFRKFFEHFPIQGHFEATRLIDVTKHFPCRLGSKTTIYRNIVRCLSNLDNHDGILLTKCKNLIKPVYISDY